MGTYFRKSIKILPWVTLNLNKSGASLSIGPRGAKLNIGKKGAYINSNIPGTGVYNKTKVGASLLWALGTIVVIGGIGYVLGMTLHNFTLFVVMCVVALLAGIAAFFISKTISAAKAAAQPAEEAEVAGGTKAFPKRKTTKTVAKTATRTGKASTPQRTDKASAKAYISEVERLAEVMAQAETLEDLNNAHNELLDIMYTNIKPLGVKVFGMEFSDALNTIEQEYAEGVKQLSGEGE